MAVISFPFPARNAAYPNKEDILNDPTFAAYPRRSPAHKAAYDRARSDEAKAFRLQYLSVEEELDRALRYVSPCDHNANTFSFKFADIIRSAANMFEILSKTLYAKFYNCTDELNIFCYLALDIHLELCAKKLVHLVSIDGFPNNPEVLQPFRNVIAWDRKSEVMPCHIPSWWSSYNSIKHSNAGVMTHATLANATASVAANFLVIERVYGFGILNGGMFDMPTAGVSYLPRWSRVFSQW